MFQSIEEEVEELSRSQFVILKKCGNKFSGDGE
jgi:hypothetical protein